MNLEQYFSEIEKAYKRGDATEHTHRPALQKLIESIDGKLTAVNEPKRIKCGAPDFVVARGETPLGYFEAKDIWVDVEKEQKTNQMKRYLAALGNLILTNYLDFRWYVNGDLRMSASLGKPVGTNVLRYDGEGAAQVATMLNAFIDTQAVTISSTKQLAEKMAAIARLIRDTTTLAFNEEDLTDNKADPLHDQLAGFREVLIADLSEAQFADMYAQTICYGLFAARCNVKPGERFSRQTAAWALPKTNPFLRKMFTHIAGPDLDDRIAWAVDDLADLLARADIDAILRDFGKRTRQEDPVVHFYETFLAAYDAKMREARGVYYTPEPVVSYIVRSVDHILKKDFKLADGLADASMADYTFSDGKKRSAHKVLVLDPATGTGTFLHSVIDLIHERFADNKGMWSSYVSKHLLPRLFGFELLMAPYAVAHMKLGLQLQETGYDFTSDERLRVYLTNTLEEAHEMAGLPLFAMELAEEANAAASVKRDLPIMVVMGNPPYSGHSANTGEWIAGLMRGRDSLTNAKTANYFEVDGLPLGERNPKWLNDDYVKFIRFAQWRIEKSGAGVLAFITNHGYLDNPTFRGMRQSLMETFDDIYLLDLHGNTKKKEKSPDGSKDENVFDIQQGVAIGIFVRKASTSKKPATVRHADLWGQREVYEKNDDGKSLTGGKYWWLAENGVDSTTWTKLKPSSPTYLFVAQDLELRGEYECGWRVADLFPRTLLGPNSHRDGFAISFDLNDAMSRVEDFFNPLIEDSTLRSKYALKDNRDWSLQRARAYRGTDYKPVKCLYRPFDLRFMLYGPHAFDYHRPEINDNLLKSNLALISTRQTKEAFAVLVTKEPVGQHKLATPYDGSYVSPLYLYQNPDSTDVFTQANPDSRHPNLAPAFIEEFSQKLNLTFIPDGRGDLKKTFGPEDIFAYMYAVFHAPTYRSRYAEFLKIDFPRLPLTSNVKLFRELVPIGARLVGLHVMEEKGSAKVGYPEKGSDVVEKIRYTEPGQGSEKGRVWINAEQYFEGIPQEVWSFHVGGYQVLHKWLKDRVGRTLSYDDMDHYMRIVAALSETRTLMATIDATIEKQGGWPIA